MTLACPLLYEAESEMEQPEFKQVPIWNADISQQLSAWYRSANW